MTQLRSEKQNSGWMILSGELLALVFLLMIVNVSALASSEPDNGFASIMDVSKPTTQNMTTYFAPMQSGSMDEIRLEAYVTTSMLSQLIASSLSIINNIIETLECSFTASLTTPIVLEGNTHIISAMGELSLYNQNHRVTCNDIENLNVSQVQTAHLSGNGSIAGAVANATFAGEFDVTGDGGKPLLWVSNSYDVFFADFYFVNGSGKLSDLSYASTPFPEIIGTVSNVKVDTKMALNMLDEILSGSNVKLGKIISMVKDGTVYGQSANCANINFHFNGTNELQISTSCTSPSSFIFNVDSGEFTGGGSSKVSITGQILLNKSPVCAMVLANGVSSFSCDGAGNFSLPNVTRDSNGQVTLFAWAEGMNPYKVVFTPSANSESRQIAMALSPCNGAGGDLGGNASGIQQVTLSGKVFFQNTNTSVCAMVLANGKSMFSCDSEGNFSLEGVPVGSDGRVTLFSWADGFLPYKLVFKPTSSSERHDVDMKAAKGCSDRDAVLGP